ncbi:TolC family protein [Sphingomonas gei]|uniref:TolC family protein n=1 Tax=Sphingomonas gei TaxID=1395960 RepID=A0A4S1XJ45_9SPHN|nr:TolC family protein [Sphingomonas gei]TGX55790.1 TolC family protein [Sphingomonas gei]
MRLALFPAILLAAGIVLPSPAAADPLTYAEALARAAANAPSLKARAATTDAARSSAIAADRLPDPTLDLGISGFPVTGPNAGSLTRDDFTMATIGFSQQFPNLAKRHARAQRAAAEIGVAQAGELVEARNVRLETALAWIDLHYGERRLAQLDLLSASLDDLQKTVTARLASGSARPSQALEPEQLRAAVADRRAEMVAVVAQARARLARYTGNSDPEVSGDPPALEVDPDRLRASLDTLPALRALDAGIAAAEADVRMARADKRPDWRVGVSYGRRDPAFGDLASVGVSVDLPLFAGRRQNPKIDASKSQAQRARFDREAGERELVAALDADLADHAMHHERLRNARETLVPLAKRRAELDRDSYAAGKLDLGTALLSTLALAEAEVETLNREAEVARDAVRITITYQEERP